MTPSTRRLRTPGSRLLKIARFMLTEQMVAAAVEPTIADLQREIAAATGSRVRQLRIRCRGYLAVWTVMAVAPFAVWASSPDEARNVALPTRTLRLMIVVTAIAFLVSGGPWPLVGLSIVAAIGGALAVGIHRWNTQHPADLPAPSERRTGTPQINFSSTEVAGNAGGLIFMLGTLFIATMGFPGVTGFLLAAMIVGTLLARWLVAWRASHPRRGLPEGRIAWR